MTGLPSAAQVEAAARRLANELRDAFGRGGLEAVNAVRLQWKAMADQLPTLAQQRIARLTLRRALEHLRVPEEG